LTQKNTLFLTQKTEKIILCPGVAATQFGVAAMLQLV